MATYPEAITNGLRSVVCGSAAFAENFFGYLGGGYSNVLKPGSSPNAPVGDVGFAYLAQQAAGLRGLYCDEKPDLPEPQFEGGQCPVLYRLGYRVSGVTDDGTPYNLEESPQESDNTGFGPISNPRVREGQSGRDVGVYDVKNSQGETVTFAAFVFVRGSTNNTIEPWVARADGGPDDCGNPPPVKPVVNNENNNYQVDVTYTNNEGTDITISPTFAFGFLQVTPTLNLTIPFRVELPDFNTVNNKLVLDGTLNLSNNEVNFNFGAGQPAPTDSPTDSPPDSTEPVPDTPPDEPEPDAEKESRIVGVQVVVSNPDASNATPILQTGSNPTVWGPYLGLVSFLIQFSDSEAAWTPDIPVKNTDCYIPCPASFGAIAVRGSPRLGASLELTAAIREFDTKEFPD